MSRYVRFHSWFSLPPPSCSPASSRVCSGSACRRSRWACSPSRCRRAGARHRHRAGDRHQYLADLCRPLPARHRPAAVAADGRHRDRHLAQPRAVDRPLRALRHRRARRAAGDLCDRRLEQIQLQGRAPQREMDRRHRRPRHRRDFGGDRRPGHPLDAVHAGDRHGEGRTGAGARRVLHHGDGGARLQPHQLRA